MTDMLFRITGRTRRGGARLAAVSGALLLAGCAAVGPDYERPEAATAPSWKEVQWKPGEPMDDLARGPWWELFGDPVLNDLQERARNANQDLRAAFAAVNQARAIARIARSEQFPTIEASPGYRRERFSPNQEPDFGAQTVDTFVVPLDLTYEVDLWGRVRRAVEGARADAQSTAALFQNVLLALHAEVAQTYFGLRALDAEVAVLEATLALRREQLDVVTGRLEAGLGIELDVARAATELATAEAELAAVALRRAEFENALAVLVGEPPPTFRVEPLADAASGLAIQPPEVPPGLPSSLLERRPDIAAAERRLAAENARIGVARAAFFPAVRLTGSGGFLSAEVEDLFNWESRAWALGPSVSIPLFTGGRNRANLQRAQARYEEVVAQYRQQVLIAFEEVQNALAAIRLLAEQSEAQQRALASARRARDLAMEGFTTGLTDYLGVIDADRAAHASQRANVQITAQRLIASVQLIRALGGGWHAEELTLPVASKIDDTGRGPERWGR